MKTIKVLFFIAGLLLTFEAHRPHETRLDPISVSTSAAKSPPCYEEPRNLSGIASFEERCDTQEGTDEVSQTIEDDTWCFFEDCRQCRSS